MNADPSLCPQAIRESVDAYVSRGMEPGAFVRAVLAGSLFDAVLRADETNLALLPHITAFVYQTVPASICGSVQSMVRHIERKERELARARVTS